MTTTSSSPALPAPAIFRLRATFSERVWGRTDLRPWYAETGTAAPVGEAWLTGPQAVVETGPWAGQTLGEMARHGRLGEGIAAEFPLLVKILFPSDKLSVQVHPDDDEAQAMGEPRGKTECWYVLEAEPGASVACGLKKGVGREDVARGVADGTLEAMMEQVPVAAGDMVFVDAGTVHAIGPGVVMLETQQTSDVTYRLFDYGRPRELHLERGLAVMKEETAAGKVAPRAMEGFVRLIEQRYFVVDRFDLRDEVRITMPGAGCLVGIGGSGVVLSGEQELELRTGQAIVVPSGAEVLVAPCSGCSLVRCFAPA